LLGDSAVVVCAAGTFFLASAEVRRAVFEDVPHAGASSKNAQLPRRQCRMVSFKPGLFADGGL
jgi:hypothetical protein